MVCFLPSLQNHPRKRSWRQKNAWSICIARGSACTAPRLCQSKAHAGAREAMVGLKRSLGPLPRGREATSGRVAPVFGCFREKPKNDFGREADTKSVCWLQSVIQPLLGLSRTRNSRRGCLGGSTQFRCPLEDRSIGGTAQLSQGFAAQFLVFGFVNILLLSFWTGATFWGKETVCNLQLTWNLKFDARAL